MPKTKKLNHIKVYDKTDTTTFIDKNKPLALQNLGFKLPPESPTKVVSLRLPRYLLNQIRAYATNIDMSYQAYIKYTLGKAIRKDSSRLKQKS